MFNREPVCPRRNVIVATLPPYNRGPLNLRRDAVGATPPLYFGATTSSQKCQLLIAPMGRVTMTMQQCRLAVTLPNHSTGGHWVFAAMPCGLRPRLILVPLDHRIMPNTERANGKGQSIGAAMPACRHPSQPFNRGSSRACRNAIDHAPPPYNREPFQNCRNAKG